MGVDDRNHIKILISRFVKVRWAAARSLKNFTVLHLAICIFSADLDAFSHSPAINFLICLKYWLIAQVLAQRAQRV